MIKASGGAVIKTAGSMTEIVVIYKCPAAGDVGVVVEDDCPVSPSHSPMTPSPPKAPEETRYSESDAKGNPAPAEEPRTTDTSQATLRSALHTQATIVLCT